MKIADMSGKRICILGFGREGRSVFEALQRYAPGCRITIADQAAPRNAPDECTLKFGPEYLEDLHAFDWIVKSPGIPPHPEIVAMSHRVTSATQLFFDSVAPSGAEIVGITGSKGKSTTASLVAAILKAGGKNVFLVGNIGEPVLDHLGDASSTAVFVMEMSSYQLADLRRSPHCAVITSFFPEHLDYHGSIDAYREAKANIVRFQTERDRVFFAKGSEGARAIAERSRGEKVAVSPLDSPLPLQETRLIGTHNLGNIALAWNVAESYGISRQTACEAIRAFTGLPHRLESLGTFGGISWVDDSISTTPESAMAALEALENVATIILGGQDRGLDFSPLAQDLRSSPVRTVILLPESGKRIRAACEAAQVSAHLLDAHSLEEAVALAKEHTPGNEAHPPVVLLSPASPSYGMFKNFEERGEAFRRAIFPE